MKKIMLFCVISCFQASLLFCDWSLNERLGISFITSGEELLQQGLSSSTGFMVILNHKGNPVFFDTKNQKLCLQEGRIFVMDRDGKLENIARKHYGDRYNGIKETLQKMSQNSYNKWVQ